MERAGDILINIISSTRSGSGAKYLPVFKNFQSVCGKDLARHITLRDIQNNVLIAEVSHPGWLQATLLKKDILLKRINSRYPGLDIKDIKVTMVKKPVSVSMKKSGNGKVPVDKTEKIEQMVEAEKLLSGMTESDLKNALKKLFSVQKSDKRRVP